jgi:hypothetical protein
MLHRHVAARLPYSLVPRIETREGQFRGGSLLGPFARTHSRVARWLMIRGMLLVLGLVGHLLCRDLQSAPAPTEVEGTTEALLYVKRVPGKTDKEQAAIREGVLRHFRVGLDQWNFADFPQTLSRTRSQSGSHGQPGTSGLAMWKTQASYALPAVG